MKILSVSGTYRKGRTIDTLIEKAIEGVKEVNPGVEINKIQLIDKDIKYCKNCMVCKNEVPGSDYGNCPIDDDMKDIYPLIHEADAYIFGTPVNIGDVTAVMKAFLERIVWVFAKPGDYPIKGCPVPRGNRKKKGIIILSSGIVPPLFRMFCDSATPLIKVVYESALNTELKGSVYAGAISTKGMETYFDDVVKLGRKLVS